MSEWQQALDNYQNGVQSIAQSNLATTEGLARSKAQSIQAQMSTSIGEAGTKFGNLLKVDQFKALTTEGITAGAAAFAPLLVSGASKVAGWRANVLQGRAGALRDTAGIEESGDGAFATLQTSLNEDNAAGRPPAEVDEPAPTAPDPLAPPQATMSQADASLGVQGDATIGGRIQRAFRATADDPSLQTGYAGSGTSRNVGNAMNADLADQDQPFATPRSLGQSIGSTEDEAAANIRTAGANIGEASEGVEGAAEGLEAAASSWEMAGSALGAAMPWLAGIGAAAGLGVSIYEAIEGGKDSSKDPYAKIQGQINAQQAQEQKLSANISADQFASKIGVAPPRYGSLAAQQMNTARGSGVALHV